MQNFSVKVLSELFLKLNSRQSDSLFSYLLLLSTQNKKVIFAKCMRYFFTMLPSPLSPTADIRKQVSAEIYFSDSFPKKSLKHENTVNSRFKKDLNLQIHLHKAFLSDNRFLDSYHKSFLNQTTLDLRKEKWSFLNREFTVVWKQLLKFS
jgi:hypothetical protein